MKKIIALTALCSVFSFSVSAQNKGLDVIYGEDNRKDVFESTDSALVELSRSTAAMISPANLTTVGSEVKISARSLKERGICEKERFSKQISAASCSGFLVAPDVLVTAGHCIKSKFDCDANKWVFDFKVDHADQGAVTVPKSSVYSCKSVISTKLEQLGNKDDYAVIQLDRKVEDRRPLAFRKKGKIAKGAKVAVIGHPTGLPTKITDGAKVRSHSTRFFVTNLDTYGGNSGSAVFNIKTSQVEGILVRGDTDYVMDRELGCNVSNKCTETGCRGEDVTYITGIEALKNL